MDDAVMERVQKRETMPAEAAEAGVGASVDNGAT